MTIDMIAGYYQDQDCKLKKSKKKWKWYTLGTGEIEK